MMKHTLPLIIVAMIGMSSCIQRPEGVVSDKKMTKVVTDLELAEAYVMNNPGGGNLQRREAIIEYVIRKNGLTREEYDSTMAWYGRNIDEYRNLYASVDKEIMRRRRNASGQIAAAETSDLWPYSRHAMITELSGSNAINYNIPSPLVNKGDRIEFKMRMRYPVGGSSLLAVEYDNGVVSYISQKNNSRRAISISLQTDTSMTVKRIFGNFTVGDSRDLPVWADSIYMHATPYDSLEYYRIHALRSYSLPNGVKQQ
ncbi:MAG: DUF4296 domain-containing protein [Candidatus Amulumruptor caecigallinarius]|nr:DUF4296 domain-containing protein [Candidatus Amulumruptor caecigallinarius]